ncbi:hypothetical protein DDT56_09125 [Brenneria corticis]|uniref:Uncharacterized protein n=1 Tax=Brenneria corticis TaxID=2173106 RepID=A0A2U1U5H9_9GAMM|nr:hypothetical protein DDT56_09125 [Brenneria sp. CFCC 11842]
MNKKLFILILYSFIRCLNGSATPASRFIKVKIQARAIKGSSAGALSLCCISLVRLLKYEEIGDLAPRPYGQKVNILLL